MPQLQKPLRGSQLNVSHPAARGLANCWLMNELTGTEIWDLAARKTSVSFNGDVQYLSDALDFDGDQDYVLLPHSNEIVDFSIEIIFVADSIAATQDVFTDQQDSKILRITGGSGGLVFWWRNGAGTYRQLTTGGFVITAEKKHHVIITRNSITGDNIIYVDGGQKGILSTDTGNSYSVSGSRVLGIQSALSTNDFNGRVWLHRIWNRALSAEEIIWIYREPYAMFAIPRRFAGAAPGGNAPTAALSGPIWGPLGGPIG